MATEIPNKTIHDAATGKTLVRPMTDDEYAELIASGWTPGEEAETE